MTIRVNKTKKNYKRFTYVACMLADKAREIALNYFRSIYLTSVQKKDNSPVTIVDKKIEAMMREIINKEFPTHGILGEEHGTYKIDSEYVWVIDPIDGTKNFIIGRPIFGILFALLHCGKPILGLIDQPFTKERWFAQENTPTTYNKTTISCNKNISFDKIKLLSSSPDIFQGEEKDFIEKIKKKILQFQWETECYGYGLLAMGLVDVIIEKYLKPHDYFPLVKIVENAGGIITDFNGFPLTLKSDGRVVASGNFKIHEQILSLIDSQGAK